MFLLFVFFGTAVQWSYENRYFYQPLTLNLYICLSVFTQKYCLIELRYPRKFGRQSTPCHPQDQNFHQFSSVVKAFFLLYCCSLHYHTSWLLFWNNTKIYSIIITPFWILQLIVWLYLENQLNFEAGLRKSKLYYPTGVLSPAYKYTPLLFIHPISISRVMIVLTQSLSFIKACKKCISNRIHTNQLASHLCPLHTEWVFTGSDKVYFSRETNDTLRKCQKKHLGRTGGSHYCCLRSSSFRRSEYHWGEQQWQVIPGRKIKRPQLHPEERRLALDNIGRKSHSSIRQSKDKQISKQPVRHWFPIHQRPDTCCTIKEREQWWRSTSGKELSCSRVNRARKCSCWWWKKNIPP